MEQPKAKINWNALSEREFPGIREVLRHMPSDDLRDLILQHGLPRVEAAVQEIKARRDPTPRRTEHLVVEIHEGCLKQHALPDRSTCPPAKAGG